MPTREDMQALGQEIVQAYDERVKGEEERRRITAQEIAQRRSDVAAQLKECDEAHAAMSRELRAKLSKDEQERRETATEELRQRKAAEEERRTTTAQEIAQRKADVSTMLNEFAQGDAQRRSDVAGQLKGYRDEQAGASAAWQELTATMQARRGAAVAVAEAPTRVPAVAPAEEAATGAEVAELTEELAAISDRVFEHLANHPDGTRLVELEREFGLNRLQSGRVVRRLLDDGKVEKRDLLYFAI